MSAVSAQILGWLEELREPLIALGWFGVLLYAAGFSLLQLGMVPVMPLGMAAGAIFGFGRGYAALMLGCFICTIVNFLISRHVARDWAMRRFGGHRAFQILNRAIETRGARMIFLLRFLPIPFGLANYAYGLTTVQTRPFVLGTTLAILLPNFLFVWIGVTAGDSLVALAGKGRPHHPLEWVLVGVGILVMSLAIKYLGTVARQEFNKPHA